jgi:hypothetical protein
VNCVHAAIDEPTMQQERRPALHEKAPPAQKPGKPAYVRVEYPNMPPEDAELDAELWGISVAIPKEHTPKPEYDILDSEYDILDVFDASDDQWEYRGDGVWNHREKEGHYMFLLPEDAK